MIRLPLLPLRLFDSHVRHYYHRRIPVLPFGPKYVNVQVGALIAMSKLLLRNVAFYLRR